MNKKSNGVFMLLCSVLKIENDIRYTKEKSSQNNTLTAFLAKLNN